MKDLFFGQGVSHTILLLALVIGTGIYLGRFKVKGVSLGSTWILFVGILVSHFGFRADPEMLRFIKEFGLIQYKPEEIRDYFPELRKYNNQCRFSDCSHTHEPGCKVLEALEGGEIAPHRYDNYLNILHDNDMMIAEWQLR